MTDSLKEPTMFTHSSSKLRLARNLFKQHDTFVFTYSSRNKEGTECQRSTEIVSYKAWKSLHEHTAAIEQTEEKVISLHFVFWGDLSSHSKDRSLLSSRIATQKQFWSLHQQRWLDRNCQNKNLRGCVWRLQTAKAYWGDISACQDMKHKHVFMRKIK